MAEARAELDAVQDALAAAREEVARLETQADERRLSFEISIEDFLEFADGVAKLAEAERAAQQARERVLAGEGVEEVAS